jgi:predicted AlkP superfamily pyrophosphatase or phosphodiesterase
MLPWIAASPSVPRNDGYREVITSRTGKSTVSFNCIGSCVTATNMNKIVLLLTILFLGIATPAAAKDTPVTILVSIDGFRPDYLERGITPHMSALAKSGVRARMQPSFPTKTFPNHTTLVTGLRPDRHGITGNSMIDPRRPGQMFSLGDSRQSLDPFWWSDAEPIWITAEKAGIRTATMFWPGSELGYGDPKVKEWRPEDWARYDQNVSGEQRVNGVLDWLRRPASIRPKFVTLYFDTVDTAGHKFGPDSTEVNAAITDVDDRIGDLVKGIAAMRVAANFIIVADHGMAAISEDRVIQLDTLIDKASYIAVETGPYAAIEPVTDTDNRVAEALLKPHDHMQCLRKEDLPPRLYYGKNPRVAAIICMAEPKWTILSGIPQYETKGGNHGWDNAMPEMDALFLASGPAFGKGVTLKRFENVDIYPLLAKVIGVNALPSDGDIAPVAGALVEAK